MSEIRENALQDVLQEAGFESYKVKEEFISKRNSVFLLEVKRKKYAKVDGGEQEKIVNELAALGLFDTGHSCDCGSCSSCQESCSMTDCSSDLAVWKQAEQGDDCEYEVAMLNLLRYYKVNVPRILASNDAGILLEYIEGENLCELFAKAEKDNDYAEEIIVALARWFKGYYDATGGKSRGDINLRNFIYDSANSRLYGIDFENTNFRSPIYDVGDLLAYLINYEPAFTGWKCEWIKRVAAAFIMELNLRSDQVREQYRQALRDLEIRRSVVVPEFVFNLLDEI
ncbi:MAG: hypothetical protein IJP33_02845 [Firmicutes bacterium]|nr:hypothetical protein [Bacillota bacterium]